jgi:hypothetical protein
MNAFSVNLRALCASVVKNNNHGGTECKEEHREINHSDHGVPQRCASPCPPWFFSIEYRGSLTKFTLKKLRKLSLNILNSLMVQQITPLTKFTIKKLRKLTTAITEFHSAMFAVPAVVYCYHEHKNGRDKLW